MLWIGQLLFDTGPECNGLIAHGVRLAYVDPASGPADKP